MSLSGKFVSVDVVLDKLYRNYPFQDIDFQDVVVWVGEGVAELGVRASLVEKTATVRIENHRGELPCDIYEMHTGGVRDKRTLTPMVSRSDRFFHGEAKAQPLQPFSDRAWSYDLNDNFIFTQMEEGEVEISYRGFKTDEKGYPMIPDNETYILGVVGHVAERIAFKKFLSQKMDESRYQHVSIKARAAKGEAISEASIPSRDEQQAFINQWVRMLPSFNPHDYGDRNLIERERLKKH